MTIVNFTLPKDNNQDVVQALSPIESVTQSISNGGQVRFAIPTNTDIVRIASAANCYVKFGNSGVVATSADMLFPTGAEVFSIKSRGYTHVSLLGIDVSPSSASITRMN